MQRKTLIDSGPLVALFNKDDHYHQDALKFIEWYRGEFYSSIAVVTEVCYLLDFSVSVQLDFLKWVNRGAVALDHFLSSDLSKIIRLTEKYHDVPMDFADSTLVAIGERLNIKQIATIDHDFYIYRFKRKQAFINIFFEDQQ